MSQEDHTQPSRESHNTPEIDIPKLEIPHLTYGQDWDEPTDTELDGFFGEHPDAWERVIACPQINRDSLDDWGIYGYLPGFIYVKGVKYKGAKSLNDMAFLGRQQGEDVDSDPVLASAGFKHRRTALGQNMWTIDHYDFFPRYKLDGVTITSESHPSTFAYLHRALEVGKGSLDVEDLASLSPEDLMGETSLARDVLQSLRHYESTLNLRKSDLAFWQEHAKTGKPMYTSEADNVIANALRRKDYASRAKGVEEVIAQMEAERPRYEQLTIERTERYLRLLEACEERESQLSQSLAVQRLRFGRSLEEEDATIGNAIVWARQHGDQNTAERLQKLNEKLMVYRQLHVWADESPFSTPQPKL